MRSQAVQEAARRVGWVYAVLALCFLGLAGRAAWLSVVDQRALRLGQRQLQTAIELAPSRGAIYDRSREALTVTVMAPSVYVSPTELEARGASLRALADALALDRGGLARRLAGRSGFTYVARWVSAEQEARVEALALPGVGIVREPRRAFPAGPLAGAVLGFANIDGVGVRGIEQQEDAFLRGEPQRIAVERDARGRLLVAGALRPDDLAGGDLALTIDAAMQAEAEADLAAAVEASGARGGYSISMDPRTGEILALAEAPGFDPNRFREVDYPTTRSRAFLDVEEPGSTFKVFVVAAALESDAVDEQTRLDCTGGTYRVRGKTIRDHHDYGVLDVHRTLAVSSNCGAVQIAEHLGPRLHYETLRRFGFGERTGSGFPFESAGLLRPWDKWRAVDHATVAYGQGVSVTPIQLAAAMGALANGGVRLTPHLVSARRAPGGRWVPEPRDDGVRVVSRETAETVLRMMEGVVSGIGTGRRAGLHGVRVAGKTGTAQKLDVDRGRYSRTRYVAWFVGAVPADDPRLVVVTALDEPTGDAHGGGDVAAPLFARVAAYQLARMGIATRPEPVRPEKYRSLLADESEPTPEAPAEPARAFGEYEAHLAETESETIGAPPVQPSPTPVVQSSSPAEWSDGAPVFVPEFRGATVAEVRRLAAEHTLEVEFVGHGLAIGQDPAPGTVLSGGERRVRVHFAGTGRI